MTAAGRGSPHIFLLVGSTLVFSWLVARPACALSQSREAANLQQIVKLIEQRKLAQAEAELQAALQQDPKSSTIYRVLGFVYQRQQRLPEAEHALEESLRLSPRNNPQALFLLAQTKFALKKPREAVALAQQLSSLAANDPQMHYALGRLLRENGQVHEGLVELERAHSLEARDPAVTKDEPQGPTN